MFYADRNTLINVAKLTSFYNSAVNKLNYVVDKELRESIEYLLSHVKHLLRVLRAQEDIDAAKSIIEKLIDGLEKMNTESSLKLRTDLVKTNLFTFIENRNKDKPK